MKKKPTVSALPTYNPNLTFLYLPKTALKREKPLDEEIWGSPPGYEGDYAISSFGRIKSIKTHKSDGRRKSPAILKLSTLKDGYRGIALYKNGVSKNHILSRLVAKTFIPNPEGKPQVNHINGDKSDNRAQNLEWVTDVENKAHAIKNGYYDRLYVRLRKPVIQIKCGEIIANYSSLTEASSKTGISITSICNCLRGDTKRAGKFNWLYA